MKEVDIAIIGCGLAGAAVAWQSHRRGSRIAIIDRGSGSTCSRVAAGLVTPITGSRGAMSWEWPWFFEELLTYYPWVEQATGCSCWQVKPAIKIFLSEDERSRYMERWGAFSRYERIDPSAVPQARNEDLFQTIGLRTPWGGCEMSPAGRLRTIEYLDATRTYFQSRDEFMEYELQCDQDIRVDQNGPEISPLDIRARAVVFCQGFESRSNPWFSALPLHPARGDILTITTDQPQFDQRVMHHDAWIVPLDLTTFRIGATYDRTTLDDLVDSRPSVMNAREELIQRWKRVLEYSTRFSGHSDCQVIDHRAAVRPASYDRKPLLGRHPVHPNVYCLNGLGSKGSLMAPRLAKHLLDAIDGSPIDPRFAWTRKSSS